MYLVQMCHKLNLTSFCEKKEVRSHGNFLLHSYLKLEDGGEGGSHPLEDQKDPIPFPPPYYLNPMI